MKKALALILCLIMVAALAVSTISADEARKIDARELQDYGQLHFYLEPVEPTEKPTIDGKVSENEYTETYEYTPTSDPIVAKFEPKDTGVYTDTEKVNIYMSSDGESFFVAFVVKDKAYYGSSDSFMINIGAKDAGRPVDGVSRLRYDFGGDASQEALFDANVKTGMSKFWKNEDGSWGTAPSVNFDDHVGERGLSWNESTGELTLEVEFKIQPILDYWLNDQMIEDARLYFFPIIVMHGDSAEGAGDGPLNQGYLWFYFNAKSDPNIKLNFMLDYPETSYWMDWEGHIVHFCKEPDPTTPAPTTTVAPTTPAPTTAKPTTAKPTTATPTTAAPTTAAPTDAPAATTAAPKDNGGCGGTIALSALALVPMLGTAVVFGKKKEN